MGQMINGKIVTLGRCQPPQAERKACTLQKVPRFSCPTKAVSGSHCRGTVLLSNGDRVGCLGLEGYGEWCPLDPAQTSRELIGSYFSEIKHVIALGQ